MCSAYYTHTTNPFHFRHSNLRQFVTFFRGTPGGPIPLQLAFSLIFVHTLALSRHHLHLFLTSHTVRLLIRHQPPLSTSSSQPVNHSCTPLLSLPGISCIISICPFNSQGKRSTQNAWNLNAFAMSVPKPLANLQASTTISHVHYERIWVTAPSFCSLSIRCLLAGTLTWHSLDSLCLFWMLWLPHPPGFCLSTCLCIRRTSAHILYFARVDSSECGRA